MSDSSEPSYYEIALTNRQVLVSFVVLLGCVLSAFVAGVWVGRMDRATQAADSAPVPEPEVEAGELAGLEEFQFPSAESGDGLRKPDLSELRGDPGGQPAAAPPPPRRQSTLAEDVDRKAPPPRARPAPPETRPAPPPATTPTPKARPAPPTPRAAPPSAAPAGEELIIQVFSTRDEAQAKKVIANLRRGGHQAFLSPVDLGGQTRTYRVRIGPFTSRAAAEKVAAEIRKDYKLETWVTAASN